MNEVWITRPEHQSGHLARMVVERGLDAVVIPALCIAPLENPTTLDEALRDLERYRFVVFVSPNAIQITLARLTRPWPKQVAIGVMGPASAEVLAGHGLVSADYTILVPDQTGNAQLDRFDSEALLARLDRAGIAAGESVLIVKGVDGRPWLADQLAARNVTVITADAYERRIGRPDAEQQERICKWVNDDAKIQVVVTSSQTLEFLIVLVRQANGEPGVRWLARQRLVVPHQRIAENATRLGFESVVLAGPGDANIARTLE